MTDLDVSNALREVIDPEIGVYIVDLGLVYGIAVSDDDVRITMTMTSPACPLGEYLQDLVQSTIAARVPNARHITVDIVSEPPWTDDRMSPEARRQLSGGQREGIRQRNARPAGVCDVHDVSHDVSERGG
jgi:metal-sulfur cluster biosynthetic enzyme